MNLDTAVNFNSKDSKLRKFSFDFFFWKQIEFDRKFSIDRTEHFVKINFFIFSESISDNVNGHYQFLKTAIGKLQNSYSEFIILLSSYWHRHVRTRVNFNSINYYLRLTRTDLGWLRRDWKLLKLWPLNDSPKGGPLRINHVSW